MLQGFLYEVVGSVFGPFFSISLGFRAPKARTAKPVFQKKGGHLCWGSMVVPGSGLRIFQRTCFLLTEFGV